MNSGTYHRRFLSLRDRFDSLYVVAPNGCWIWTGTIGRGGYGRFTVNKRADYAHRVGYRMFVGEIPEGKELNHICRQPDCVNWRHLEPLTRRDHIMKTPGSAGRTHALQTHCRRGHPFDDANTAFTKAGSRLCKECGRVRHRRSKFKTGRTSQPRKTIEYSHVIDDLALVLVKLPMPDEGTAQETA